MPSAINYFAGVEATCRITGIDDELRVFDDAPVVVAGMIGGNEHAIILVEVLQKARTSCADHTCARDPQTEDRDRGS